MNIDLAKTQLYLEWFKENLYLNAIAVSAGKRNVHRGQVYQCKLGAGIGSEESKQRPCVILQHDSANKYSPNTIVAPITHTTSTLPIVIPLVDKFDSDGNVVLNGNVLLGNIVCISKARLGDHIIDLTPDEMKKVDNAISLSLDLNHYYQTLQNAYNDKLQYIEKLKSIRNDLNKEITNQKQILDDYQALLVKFHLPDIKALEIFLEKHSKDT